MQKRKILVPSYMQQFQCIGPSCEDTCCIGWRVNIDEVSYKKYSKMHDKELRPIIEKNIKKNKSNRSHENFAQIKMLPNQQCVFFSEEKMCKIQVKHGEEYLSNTCAIYPRQINEVDSAAEKSATMSCPEAARLALLNPEGINFIEIEEPVEVRYIPQKTLHTKSVPFTKKAQEYFLEIRTFIIQLLQYRDISLNDRLVLLGSFCQKLQECISNKDVDSIPSLFSYYTNWLEDDVSRESLDNIPANYGLQMQLIKEILDERLALGVNNQRYIECVNEMLSGLQYIHGSNIEDIIHQYALSYSKYYQPFMDHHEYIMENYIVNHVFKNLFPFGDSLSVFESYVLLVVHYSLIKLHLIGMSAHHNGLTTDLVIKLIQSFAKTVEHNPQYLKSIIELLKKNEVTNLAYMVILIRN
jgi:lysine-N-methylase